MLKYVILGSLSYQPMSGYALKGFIDRSTAHFWHATLSQIYMVLKSLEKEGLLTSTIHPQEGRPDEKMYMITAKGQVDLDRWLAEPLTEIEPTKDTLLLKLFFSARIDKVHILTTLRLQRVLHAQALETYRDVSSSHIQQTIDETPQLSRDAAFWDITRRFGELAEQFYVQWLDEAITRIEKEL